MSKKKIDKAFSISPKEFKKMTGVSQKEFVKNFTKAINMKEKKKPMSLEEAYKKYGNDVTKIPGFSGRGMDGKVKPKRKVKPPLPLAPKNSGSKKNVKPKSKKKGKM